MVSKHLGQSELEAASMPTRGVLWPLPKYTAHWFRPLGHLPALAQWGPSEQLTRLLLSITHGLPPRGSDPRLTALAQLHLFVSGPTK